MKKTLLSALIGITVFIAACTKISTTEIGTGLIPAVDGINTFDTTFEVETYNEQINGADSIRISRYDEHVLGYISNDPLFGTTKATINVEMKPPYYPYGFEVREDSLILDSTVLVLSYTNSWGDATVPMTLNVAELANKIKADSTYPSYTSLPAGTSLNSGKTIDIRRLKDSLYMFKEAAINQIRIPLNNTFGNKLLHVFDSTSNGTNNAYNSDSLFSERFHGFAISSNLGSNALLRINLQDTNTKLALYYRYKTRANTLDTVVRYFRPNSISGTSNNIVRTRTGSESNTYLTNGTVQDSLLYLQAGPGLHTKVRVPGLNLFTNRVIHRAELYMEQLAGNPATDTLFTQPLLFLTAFNSDSARRFQIPNDISFSSDGTVANISSFGGYIIYKTDPFGNRVASYAFNVSRYVQGIVTRKEKVYDFYLFAPVFDYVYTTATSALAYPIYTTQLNPPAVGRVRLLGGNSKRAGKMKLRVIYSKL